MNQHGAWVCRYSVRRLLHGRPIHGWSFSQREPTCLPVVERHVPALHEQRQTRPPVLEEVLQLGTLGGYNLRELVRSVIWELCSLTIYIYIYIHAGWAVAALDIPVCSYWKTEEFCEYCRTRFDSTSLAIAKIATKGHCYH